MILTFGSCRELKRYLSALYRLQGQNDTTLCTPCFHHIYDMFFGRHTAIKSKANVFVRFLSSLCNYHFSTVWNNNKGIKI